MKQPSRVAVILLLSVAAASPALARHGHDRPGRSDRSQDGSWWTRGDDQRLRNIGTKLETDTDTFKKHLNTSLDRGRLDGTRREDNMNAAAQTLEDAADRLKRHDGDRQAARRAVRDVFAAAAPLDEIVARSRADRRTRRDWDRVNADLNALSALYPRLADNGDDRRNGRWTIRDWRQFLGAGDRD